MTRDNIVPWTDYARDEWARMEASWTAADPVRPPETDEEPPKDFGQQIMLKGWLPRELRDDDYVDEPNPAWLGAVLLVAAFVAGLVTGALLWGWPRG